MEAVNGGPGLPISGQARSLDSVSSTGFVPGFHGLYLPLTKILQFYDSGL